MYKIIGFIFCIVVLFSCRVNDKNIGMRDEQLRAKLKSAQEFANADLQNRINVDINSYERYEITASKEHPEIEELNQKEFRVYFGIQKQILNEEKKSDKNKSFMYIKEVVYFLERKHEIIPLGLFSKERKFINGLGQSILLSHSNDDFYATQFQGFTLDSLSHPLFLEYIAVDEKNNVFETDGSFNLMIDINSLLIKNRPIEY